MSLNAYQPSLGQNPLTKSFGAYLISNAYTYSFEDTLDDITTLGDSVNLSRIGATTTGTIQYTPTSPILRNATTGTVNAMLIYNVATNEPYYYVPIDTVVLNSADIIVNINATTGVVRITKDIGALEWTIEKFTAQTGTDINSTHSTSSITAIADDFANTLFVCSFSKVTTSVIVIFEPNPIVYDKMLEANPTFTDINFVHSKASILETNYNDTMLFTCSFSVIDTSAIAIADRLPVVYTQTATYDLSLIGRPDIRATRDNTVYTSTVLTLADTIPTGYSVQIDRAFSPYAQYSLLDTIDNADLPYTDTGLAATVNYKYQGRYVTTGNINGSPITVKGVVGKREYTIGKNQRL